MPAVTRRFAAVALAGLLAACATAPPAPPPELPLRDFFRNPERAYFRIAPDGRTLAFMQPWEGRRNIYVQLADGSGEPRRVTAERDRDIPDHFWKGPHRLVYLQNAGGDENDRVVVADVRTGEARAMTPGGGVKAYVVDMLPREAERMLVALNQRNRELFDVHELDLGTGALRLVAENPGGVIGWITDHDGVVRGAVRSDGVNRTYLYRERADAPFREVLTTSYRDSFTPVLFTPDNRRLYAVSNLGRDKAALVLVDPATAKEERVVFAHPEVDVQGVESSRTRKVPTAVTYVTWRTERHYLDERTERAHAAIRRKLPGYDIAVQAITDDEDRMVVAATSDRTAGTRYLYDAAADRLTKLGEVHPWLPEAQMAPAKPIAYRARDGLTIHGYLTLPVGREPKRLPVVVNPHGGPWARDAWGFNPEVQFLANRGYAVLQMNFRGSTGYGREFWLAGRKQWGLAMQDDVTDGVRWLIAEGIADPKRICIYGASYGGYATLMGLVKEPDLYACGVDYVGVSNLFTFMKSIPPYWKPMLAMVEDLVGDPVADKEQLTRTSPALNAERIRAPLLIAQGARDPRVVQAESDQMVAALKARGVDVPYLVKENEGHGFANEENQLEFYGAMERFLARYLR
jgi:dipeptidyl aminopeptidase/acylaminoacyl peptidase